MVRIGKAIADPAARPLDVEGGVPAPQMIRLHMQQTGTRYDEKNDPREAARHAQAWIKQFCRAKSKQNCRQQIGGAAD